MDVFNIVYKTDFFISGHAVFVTKVILISIFMCLVRN